MVDTFPAETRLAGFRLPLGRVRPAELTLIALLLLVALPALADGVVTRARVVAPDQVRVSASAALTDLSPANFRFVEAKAPDVGIAILQVTRVDETHVVLKTGQRLDPAGSYRLEVASPVGAANVKPRPWAMLLTAVVSAALINNFVFTRYLGLCIFFGVSKKRDTSLGMGATFLFVMLVTAMASWALFTFVLAPLKLRFLEVLVFIGVVAFLVQSLDSILKKTLPDLHRKFGIYLMLITTNCIILAVPLLNAAEGASGLSALALALGSGVGFALALFLMSCARESVDLARVPAPFQGLPVAFALAGMFALAFMGFSGLSFLK